MLYSYYTITLLVLAGILWIWAFIDITRTRFYRTGTPLVFLVLIFVIPILGPMIYFHLKRDLRKKEPRKFMSNYHHKRH